MKTFRQLTAADFPGVAPETFEEWKAAVLRARRNTVVLLVALILVNVVLILVSGTLVLGGFLLALLFVLLWYKAGRLQKELGIDKAAIKLAKARIAIAGDLLARVSIRRRRIPAMIGGSLLLLLVLLLIVWAIGVTFSEVEYGWGHIMDFWYLTFPVLIVGCGLAVLAVRLVRGRVVECFQCLGCGQQMQECEPSCPGCKADFGQGNPTGQPVDDGA